MFQGVKSNLCKTASRRALAFAVWRMKSRPPSPRAAFHFTLRRAGEPSNVFLLHLPLEKCSSTRPGAVHCFPWLQPPHIQEEEVPLLGIPPSYTFKVHFTLQGKACYLGAWVLSRSLAKPGTDAARYSLLERTSKIIQAEPSVLQVQRGERLGCFANLRRKQNKECSPLFRATWVTLFCLLCFPSKVLFFSLLFS